MSHVDVLAHVVGNCQKADARWPIKLAWVVLPSASEVSTKVDIIVKTSLPPGKKWDLLVSELLQGVEDKAEIWPLGEGTWTRNSPMYLIWRSRHR
jgi:hypothetical protein